jgi:hypothetical protein
MPKLSPGLQLAVHLMEGGTVQAHLCEREPGSLGELAVDSLGEGSFTAEGGTFKVFRRGWITCIAVPWDGQLVITRPQYLPLFGRKGQAAKCGPLQLATNGAGPQ